MHPVLTDTHPNVFLLVTVPAFPLLNLPCPPLSSACPPPQVTVIFKKLYDEDIVEEPAFKSWAEKVSKKYVDKALSQKIHDKAAPFIEWLA